jgi:glycosyltransferase involved in cell wall biosynthesis
VILAPSLELHAGYHGALLERPPSGIAYERPPCGYRCLVRATGPFPPNPFDDDSAGEEIVLAPPEAPAVVHSARLPVGGELPWLVDTDSFLATLRYGPFRPLGALDGDAPGPPDPAVTAARVAVLTARLLDDRCGSLLFWTEHDRRSSFDALDHDHSVAQSALAVLWDKSDVVPPGFIARPNRRIETGDGRPVTILYMGRTHADKGGDIALAVFAALRDRFGTAVRLVFVSDQLTTDREQPGIVPVDPVDRGEFLDLLDRSDIFFSPTLFESYGVALAEAASAGVAVVTSRGPGMEHISEILGDTVRACTVSNALTPTARTRAYVEMLTALVVDEDARRALGAANRSLVRHGSLSVDRRDRALLSHYDRLWRRRGQQRRRAHAPVVGFTEKLYTEGYLRLERRARTGDRAIRLLLS